MPTDFCRWLFLLVFLLSWTSKSYSKEIRVVCYYTNWSVYRPGAAKFSPQNINPYLCTHLIYAFGGFTKENTLKPFDKYQDIEKGGYAKFTGLKTYNKNLKTMLAIGGWNEGSSRFSPMVANPERRKELVKNAIKFLRQNHFDGLDLDWEYPSFRDGGKSRDRDNYANLVQELREEFDRESEKTGRTRLLLTMAVPAGIEYINKGYDVPKLTKYLDWMNILSYDYHSAFEPAVNHHAPLYSLEEESEYNYDGELNIDYTIKHYLKMGAEPSKLVMGIPTYGRSYTLFNPDANEIGAPADGPGDMGDATRENGYLAYYEICENIKSQDWEVVEPSDKAMGPYAYKDNQWVGYDDANIARKKSEYVAENGLGGIMFWSIDNDDFRGTCHGKPYPIIEAAKEALISAYGLTDENLVSPVTKSSKTKTRSRTSAKTERPEPKSTTLARRNRIKSKSSDSSSTSSRSKSTRRNNEKSRRTTEGPVYSSLELVTPSYTTPAPPSTPDQGGVFKCEDEGFYPHPKDCKKYFWCLSGPGETGIVAHHFTCPAGLYFNKLADSCDYTRNVLCNKKLSKGTTTTTTTEASTSKTTSLGSTTRVPPKITAATSRTTVFRTTTTTEPSFEDEYEDEYEDDDDNNSEEDPKVIKELLDLIKKAGGIEQLEKQLKIGEDGASLITSDITTPSSISKTLVERVLKSRNNFSSGKKTTSNFLSNRNSRGPQNEGLTRTEEKSTADKGRLQYTTISRQRPAKVQNDEKKDIEDDESEDDDEEDEEEETSRGTTKAKQPQYVNIRRGRISSSTTEESASVAKNTINRNKILGEDTEDDDDEDEKNGNRQSITPQYVSIRRQRPSTTEGTSTSKYTIIRRGTTTEAPDEEEIDKNQVKKRGSATTANSSQGSTENRSRGTTTAASSLGTTLDGRRRGTTTTTASSDNSTNELSTKYKTISRGTTTETANDKSTLGSSTARYVAISRGTTSASSDDDDNLTTILSSDEELPLTTIEQLVITTPESLSIQTVASLSTTTRLVPGDQSTIDNSAKRTTPQLLEPRPFSFVSTRGSVTTSKPVTEPTTTKIAKVSESNYKLRVRQNVEGESSTVSTPITRSRAPSRFKLTTPSATNLETPRPSISSNNRARKRFSTTTTEANNNEEEYDIVRNYRPSELADLSSLTAVDFQSGKDSGRFGGGSNRQRRPRPSPSTTTTQTPEESLKTGSRTLPLARKLLDSAIFGKSRRVVPNKSETEDQINSSSDVTSRIRGSARATTPPSLSSNSASTTRPTLRSRKIIRRFRPTSTEASNVEDDLEKSSTFKQQIIRSTTEKDNALSLLLNRNLVRSSTTQNPISTISSGVIISRNSTEKSNEINTDGDQNDEVSSEEEENIKLSESNIRENNDVNNGNIISDDKKVRRKVLKRVKALIDGKDADDVKKDVSSSTEPNIIVRTRKIVRKLKPTEPTLTSTTDSSVLDNATESTDASTLARKRKIFRRLRPTTESTNSVSNQTDSTTNEEETTPENRTVYIRGRLFTAQSTPSTTTKSEELDLDDDTDKEEVKKFKPSKFKYKPLSVKAQEEAAAKKEAEEEEAVLKKNKPLLDKPKYKTIIRSTTARSTTEEDSERTKLTIDRSKYQSRGSTSPKYDIEDEDEDYDEDENDDEEEEGKPEEIVTIKYRILRPSSTPPTISVDAKKTRILRPSITSGEIKLEPTSTESNVDHDNADDDDEDFEGEDDSEDDEEILSENVKNYTNPIIEKQRNRPTFKAPKLTTETSVPSTTNNRPKYKILVRSTTAKSILNATTGENTSEIQNITTTGTTEEFSSEGVDITKSYETTTPSATLSSENDNISLEVLNTTTASTVEAKELGETRTSTEESEDLSNESTTDTIIETATNESAIETTSQVTNNETLVETTPETVSNSTTEATTPYQPKSTLRSIQNRPKFSVPKKLSNNPSDSSTTSSTTSRTGLRFNQRTRESTTPLSTRLSTVASVPQRPKFISKFSTTERSRFSGNRFAADADEEIDEGQEEGEEDDEESSPPKVVPIRFPTKFSTTERSLNRFGGRFGSDQNKEDDEDENVGVEEEDDEEGSPVKVPVTRLTPLKPKINLNRYSTSGRNRFTPKPTDQNNSEEETLEDEDEPNDPQEEEDIEELPSSPSYRPTSFNQRTTSKPRVSNRPTGIGFRKTTTSQSQKAITEDLSDIDTEAVKNRNKNLFSKKRKMNTPVNGASTTSGSAATSTEDHQEESKSTASPIESTTKASTASFETTELLTTLHHIFAESEPVTENSTNEITGNSVVERLIEVNRIVEVHGDSGLINRTLENGSKVDKIGAVNRVTNIKIVDPQENEITSTSNNGTSSLSSGLRINIDGAYVVPEVATVQEVPNPQSGNRGDRKLDLYSQNRVVNYGGFNSVAVPGNAEIIDGKSHINIITPRPYFSTEATTLPIEGLFPQTDKSKTGDGKSTLEDELLETDHSRFVNVRILDQDPNVRLDKGLKDDTGIVPIRVLKSEDYITMKAEVVEVTPKAADETIRIVPIKVEMSRRLIGNADFNTKVEKGAPKVNIKFVGS